MKLISEIIESVSIWSGKAVSFLLIPLIGVICYEVTARYVFGAPTPWGYEAIIFVAGTVYVIGGAYTLHARQHIIVDVLYNYFPPRVKAFLDIFVGFVFFLMYVGIVLIMGGYITWESFILGERSGTYWNPPLYPIQAMVPLGAFLILLQGLAKLIGDIKILIRGKE